MLKASIIPTEKNENLIGMKFKTVINCFFRDPNSWVFENLSGIFDTQDNYRYIGQQGT